MAESSRRKLKTSGEIVLVVGELSGDEIALVYEDESAPQDSFFKTVDWVLENTEPAKP
jgi:hypothetical protein